MNKFLFFTVAGLNLQKKDRAVFLSHWSLLTELCCCYVELGKVYLRQGAVREAKRFFKDGREITRRFLSANRWVKAMLHYTICLAILLRHNKVASISHITFLLQRALYEVESGLTLQRNTSCNLSRNISVKQAIKTRIGK